jgi:hypothetical protein
VILRAYCAFRLEFLANNRSDFARFLMTRGNHERRFTGPECLQMLQQSQCEEVMKVSSVIEFKS